MTIAVDWDVLKPQTIENLLPFSYRLTSSQCLQLAHMKYQALFIPPYFIEIFFTQINKSHILIKCHIIIVLVMRGE